MRMIVQFGKIGRLKYISHLDLQRFMQRALRRTDLPVAYSQGFNPHPQISFASALAMGHASECELLDVKLSAPVDPMHAIKQMSAALPPEMPVHTLRMVDDAHPKLMARLAYAEYRITLEPDAAAGIARAIEGYLAEASVMAIRKTKTGERPADIRPMTAALHMEDECILFARLKLTEAETLKPDLLLEVLAERGGTSPGNPAILRTGLLAERDETLVPLIDL